MQTPLRCPRAREGGTGREHALLRDGLMFAAVIFTVGEASTHKDISTRMFLVALFIIMITKKENLNIQQQI